MRKTVCDTYYRTSDEREIMLVGFEKKEEKNERR